MIVEFADVRILALGVLNNPRSNFSVNDNAHALLHPPGVWKSDGSGDVECTSTMHTCASSEGSTVQQDFGMTSLLYSIELLHVLFSLADYDILTCPQPLPSHLNYPLFTPGGKDCRWVSSGGVDEHGQRWVGVMLYVSIFLQIHTFLTLVI